jgi:hypothetical protein
MSPFVLRATVALVRLEITLERGDRLEGQITGSEGTAIPFVGRLGLLAALERLTIGTVEGPPSGQAPGTPAVCDIATGQAHQSDGDRIHQ